MDWWGWIFPRRCVGCGRWGRYICDACRVGMVEVEQMCPGCKRYSLYGLRHTSCVKEGALIGLTMYWENMGIVKRLLEEVDAGGYFDCLGELWEESEKLMQRKEFTYLRRFVESKPVVIPVPEVPKVERQLGFNPSEKLGKLICRDWGLGMTKGWVRKNGNEEEKWEWKTRESRKLPRQALLVGETWGSGKRRLEAASALREGGINKVWGLVLAREDGDEHGVKT